jgi:hypothetical protein
LTSFVGLSSNQFGLIGFGGEGIHNTEHSHTINGQILGSSKDFKQASSSLSFTKEGENTDVFKVGNTILLDYLCFIVKDKKKYT